jgi:hypothetical protein
MTAKRRTTSTDPEGGSAHTLTEAIPPRTITKASNLQFWDLIDEYKGKPKTTFKERVLPLVISTILRSPSNEAPPMCQVHGVYDRKTMDKLDRRW